MLISGKSGYELEPALDCCPVTVAKLLVLRTLSPMKLFY